MREPTALVIDDDPDIRQVLSSFLKHFGHVVRQAESADEALALLNDDVTVVFCDIHMPGQSGLEILDRMQQQVPVVMITADASSAAAVEALRGGAVDFLRKPFRAVDVKEALKRAQERAIQTPKKVAQMSLLNDLLAGVAHELRSPLTWVGINLEVMEELAQTQPEMQTLVAELKEGSKQMKQIVNSVRSATNDRFSERYDVGQAVKAAMVLGHTNISPDTVLQSQISSDLYVHGIRGRLTQAVTNLILNASQALGRPGHVDVVVQEATLGPDGSQRPAVQVVVIDDGPGVPEELREQIFQRAFTTRENTGGSGLGLWLSRQFVEEQGGTLEVLPSEMGARFVITLPRAR